MSLAFPKPEKRLVSPALRQSANGQKCTGRWVPGECRDDATVVLAHVRGIWSGAAQKPHDIHSCYLCRACHDALDGRLWPKPPKFEVLRAMVETQSVMLRDGLINVKGGNYE